MVALIRFVLPRCIKIISFILIVASITDNKNLVNNYTSRKLWDNDAHTYMAVIRMMAIGMMPPNVIRLRKK
jgi:hypothetical protein